MRKVFGIAAAMLVTSTMAPAQAQPVAAVALRAMGHDCQMPYTQVDKRISACTQLIRAAFNSPQTTAVFHLFRGRAYADKGDTQNALADFTATISTLPDLPEAYADAAGVLAREGKNDEASSDFERAGFFFLKKGHCSKAVPAYGEALKINPKLAAALYGRGLCERQNGNATAAQADLAAALAADPAIATKINWPS